MLDIIIFTILGVVIVCGAILIPCEILTLLILWRRSRHE